MKYLFVGNRINVLHEMIKLGLDVEIVPLPQTKKDLIGDIDRRTFDVLVSNGCPYILPIKPNKKYINVHPSLLPDLKGKSPILEAIKQGKPMGATCHLMVKKVDDGEILSQVKINPNRGDLNECYRESFRAEAVAFKTAYEKGLI
jgi:methionyl-tRNA formyltransferase